MSTNNPEVGAKVKAAKEIKSLDIKIMESDLYDWNSLARFLLCIIARSQRTNKNAFIPPDMPQWMQDDIIGWNDSAQWRIALRAGNDPEYAEEVLLKLEEDEAIEVRTWRDSTGTLHNQYRVNEALVMARQRPSQTKDVERSPRRKVKRTGNKGSFSSTNQPKREKKESKASKRIREAEMSEAPKPSAYAAAAPDAVRAAVREMDEE
jgi:hypothetical protein